MRSFHTTRPLMFIVAGLIGALVTLTPHDSRATEPDSPVTLTRIAFGSCAKQDKPQPIWDTILAQRPQLFLFIGDNVYADTDDMSVMKTKYEQLGAVPGFAKLRQTCPVLATWDDHDYGRNDAGAEYEHKQAAQQVFNDFFAVPADSPRRSREGVYGAQVFGPPGRRVQVILLDTRYFRSPLRRGTLTKVERAARRIGPYVANDADDATVLGEAQWAWLAEQLRKPADVRIIASSIQVASGEHGWETWGNFPRERARLFRLIADTNARGVVFISGDRHLGALSRYDEDDAAYPLYDLTSSGLNSGGGGNPDEPNRHAVGPIFRGDNFGMITIDWDAREPTIRLSVHDLKGAAAIDHAVRLRDLSPAEDRATSR